MKSLKEREKEAEKINRILNEAYWEIFRFCIECKDKEKYIFGEECFTRCPIDGLKHSLKRVINGVGFIR